MLKYILFIHLLGLPWVVQAQSIEFKPQPINQGKIPFIIIVHIDTVQTLNLTKGISLIIEVKNITDDKVIISNPIYDPSSNMYTTIREIKSDKELPLNYFPRIAYQHQRIDHFKEFPSPFVLDSLFNNSAKMKATQAKMAKESKFLYLKSHQNVKLYLRIVDYRKSIKPLRFVNIPKGIYELKMRFFVDLNSKKYILYRKIYTKIHLE